MEVAVHVEADDAEVVRPGHVGDDALPAFPLLRHSHPHVPVPQLQDKHTVKIRPLTLLTAFFICLNYSRKTTSIWTFKFHPTATYLLFFPTVHDKIGFARTYNERWAVLIPARNWSSALFFFHLEETDGIRQMISSWNPHRTPDKLSANVSCSLAPVCAKFEPLFKL